MNFGITGNRTDRPLANFPKASPVQVARLSPNKVKQYMLDQVKNNAFTGRACISLGGKVRSATLQYDSGSPYVIFSNFCPRTNIVGVVYHYYVDGSNTINEHRDTSTGTKTSLFNDPFSVLSVGENSCR